MAERNRAMQSTGLLSNLCKLSVAVVSSGAPLTSFCLVRGSSAYVRPPNFAHLRTAVDDGCGDAMIGGRTCPLVVSICSLHELPSHRGWISTCVGMRQGGFLRQSEICIKSIVLTVDSQPARMPMSGQSFMICAVVSIMY
jgi:hypothetical protein